MSTAQTLLSELSNRTDWADECVDWPFSVTPAGYGQVYCNRLGRPTGVHREIAIVFHGEPPDGSKSHAAHSCGNRLCCNPVHIRWATAQENAADREIHGTMLRGENQVTSKLTESDVVEIRARAERGESNMVIALDYGVTEGNVKAIVRYVSWRHVEPELRQRMKKVNRIKRGSDVASSKLTADEVIEIRHRHGYGESQRSLAHDFGVTRQNIRSIVNRNTWAHIS